MGIRDILFILIVNKLRMSSSQEFFTTFFPLILGLFFLIFIVRWQSTKIFSKRQLHSYWLLKVNTENMQILKWWKHRGDALYDVWHPSFYSLGDMKHWLYTRRISFYIRKCDGVAIWLTNSDGGIYEIGEIISKPSYGQGLISEDVIPYLLNWHNERSNYPLIQYRLLASFHSTPITKMQCENTRFLRYIVKDMTDMPIESLNYQQWEKILKLLHESNISKINELE